MVNANKTMPKSNTIVAGQTSPKTFLNHLKNKPPQDSGSPKQGPIIPKNKKQSYSKLPLQNHTTVDMSSKTAKQLQ